MGKLETVKERQITTRVSYPEIDLHKSVKIWNDIQE